MAILRPFRALRPVPDRARDVAAVPYDVVSAEEARRLAADRPLTFLHVSRAEIDLPPEVEPYDDRVYARARANFETLRGEAPLVREDAENLYLYRLQMGTHVQTGLAGAFALDDYDRNVILKHEKTRKDKEDDRTRHIVELGAQTGPVFLTYPAVPEIDAMADRLTSDTPLFDFTADDGVRHTVWRIAPDDSSRLVMAFARVPRLYIADGHHRAASAARAREAAGLMGGELRPCDLFLAVAFPHDQVQILAYNRVVKDGRGQRPGQAIEALRASHVFRPGPPVPARKGEVSVFLAGQWYTVELKQPDAAASPIATLDVSLLQDQVLGPVFGIGDPRTDSRLDFVGGARGIHALETAVGKGAFAAFSMHPVSVDDLMAIANAGEIMPPKSTWFEPKLRDGLLILTV